MATSLFRTSMDYVTHITSLEKRISETLIASSYLSSHLFSKAAVLRYFGEELDNSRQVRGIADSLWKRRKFFHANVKTTKYLEVFELDSFTAFCQKGIVHRQSPHFRATPNEVEGVLKTMIDLINHCPNYQIGFCTEILPFVFIVKVAHCLTIDVRNNFGYQRIQGLLIDDQQLVADFEKEFYRIWNEPSSICSKKEVIQLISTNLQNVSDGVYLRKE